MVFELYTVQFCSVYLRFILAGRSVMTEEPSEIDKPISREEERNAFWFIAIFFFPILSSVLVGGYGFIIWISQILLGPPGAS
ncbi:hypothetical protein A3742_03965 [Oleiphilus sp. HI0071]|nr:hypothetical protein A3737_08235 [Oleiphilus sp. HI0065]KZY87853.1 hypothetical protein A3742_03965 [Oleiphilus sp. HI0071]KZY89229.1 hypothetical protein A3744_06680 [Oleiphilus sp. HI0073]KZZ15795.1 hypothetical protein A3751_16605 [Oleiphilus sp. HI0080]KZZ49098.1 hypothetical protein A3760_22290 [Oleiphilus sp. HI0122]KZZ74064.1 hypothetical protein A3765_26275 [Oleiphilus sp. HI0130]